MQIQVQVHGFTLTDALDRHARRRLRFALDRFADPIEAVIVRLSSEHGGRSSRCQLQVQLRRRPDVLVEETRDDLYVAIDRTADRAAEAVARRVERSRHLAVRGGAGSRAGSRAAAGSPDLAEARQ